MAYIGTDISYGNLAVQEGVGDGSDVTPIATLNYTVPTSASIMVTLDGVTQVPGVGKDFTASGTTLTFSTAPANLVKILVYFLGRSLDIGTPADNTVTNAKMANNSVDSAELVAGSVDDAHLATGITASKLSGVVPTANLGTGTASSTTVLYGDGTYKAEPVTDLTAVRQDIAMLALYNAVSDNRAAYNLPFSFVDQFEDDTGITTETDCDRDVAGEYVSSSTAGAETAWPYTAFASQTMAEFGSPAMYDHPYANDYLTMQEHGTKSISGATNAIGWWPSPSGYTCGFDIDYLASYTWTKFSISNYVTNGVITDFKLQYTNEATPSSWTTASMAGASVSTLSGMTSGHDTGISGFASNGIMTFSNPGGGGYAGGVVSGFPSFTARHIRFAIGDYANAGNANSGLDAFTPYYQTTVVNATGTLISDTQTSSVATTKMSGVILYKDNAGTATLGTDLVISLSADNGSNWTEAASYGTVTPLFSTGVKMVRLGETTVTSGTAPVIKAVWANQSSGSKETQLHGWAMNY